MRRAILAVVAITAATAAVTSCSSAAKPTKAGLTASSAVSSSAATPQSAPSQPAGGATGGAAATVWYEGGGKAMITMLSADVTSVTTDDWKHDSDGVSTDCIQLAADWTPAHNYAPIPDPAAQKLWEAALATLHQGYMDCNGGYSDGNTAAAQKGVTAIVNAAHALDAVKHAVGATG